MTIAATASRRRWTLTDDTRQFNDQPEHVRSVRAFPDKEEICIQHHVGQHLAVYAPELNLAEVVWTKIKAAWATPAIVKNGFRAYNIGLVLSIFRQEG